MAKLINRLFSRGMAFIHDLLMIPLAWYAAYWLRFNFEIIPDNFIVAASYALLFLVPVQGIVFWSFGLYRGVWRFASLPDLVRITKSVVIGILISVIGLYLFFNMQGIPRSVPVLYGILLVAFLSLPRFLYRWMKDQRLHFRAGQRVMIVGAGHAGEMLARDLLRNRERLYQPVAFIDDDAKKWGKEIHGIRVMGGCDKLVSVVERLAVDIVMLAVPSATTEQMRHIVNHAEKANVPFRTVPQLNDLVSGQVSLNQLREVSIDDLLGREPVTLDWPAISQGLATKTVLVTGGGGSIGSELCRQLAALNVARLIVVDNSEFNLFSIDLNLRETHPELKLHIHLVDVSEAVAMERVFDRYQPQVVFHAAAYKHVPLLEGQLREAVRNNVLGTRNVAQMADRFNCEEFVLISTDKAVNPENIMGSTKRVAEIYCHSMSDKSSTKYITVRFGNVLGSAGSVVPVFQQQIQNGGPVTVTHPEIERFFMTVREACQLIMQASVLGDGGEIFVLDMGEPVKILYLAEQLIRLSGKEPGVDVEILFTGIRPGEKMYEELFHENETLARTEHDKIRQAEHRQLDWNELNALMTELEQACDQYDCEKLSQVMNNFVPERRMMDVAKECFMSEREHA